MTNYTFTFNDDQTAALAAGMCPRSVQSLAQFALESDEARLARNALKPIQTRATKKKHDDDATAVTISNDQK